MLIKAIIDYDILTVKIIHFEGKDMVNVFAGSKKKEPVPDQQKQEEESIPESGTSEQPTEIIQKLKAEEAQLADEKRNLLQLKEQLQKKVKDHIENTKNSVQKLKTEVDDLKAECAQLNESLQNEALIQ